MANLAENEGYLTVSKLLYAQGKNRPHTSTGVLSQEVTWVEFPDRSRDQEALSAFVASRRKSLLARPTRSGVVLDVNLFKAPGLEAPVILSPIVVPNGSEIGVGRVLREAFPGADVERANYLISLGGQRQFRFGQGITLKYEDARNILPNELWSVGLMMDATIRSFVAFGSEELTCFWEGLNAFAWRKMEVQLINVIDKLPTKRIKATI